MTKLPQRTRQHVIEDESRQYVRGILPDEWLVQDGQKDYGVDLSIEIVQSGQVTGAVFLMQLKATEAVVVRKGGYVAHSCKTSTLAYFLERPELVVYLVYDSQAKQAYWIWIQTYIRQSLKRGWRQQKTATIKIPLDNTFDAAAVDKIANRVQSHHRRAKWMAAVETAENPYFRYDLETIERGVLVHISPKYPDALADRPVIVKGEFRFDRSDPEALAARYALEQHFKTGAPAEFDARFFQGFEMPEAFSDLLGHEDEYRTTRIEVGPASRDERFSAKLSVLDEHEQVTAEIPYIEFRTVQAGTEETTLSNEDQSLPFRIRLRVHHKTGTTKMSLEAKLAGMNAVQARECLMTRHAFATGKWLVLTNVSTGLSTRSEMPDNPNPEYDEQLAKTLGDLAFIQQTTNRVIQWPGRITASQVRLIEGVANVLRTGIAQIPVTGVQIDVDESFACQLADRHKHQGKVDLKFAVPSAEINLLGTQISLGTATASIPNARLCEKALQEIGDLSQPPDSQVMSLDLVVDEPGILYFYHRWLPQNPDTDEPD